jgi:hypothetical protein
MRLAIVTLLAMGLVGCANLTSIHRMDTLGSQAEGRVIFTDAKQRAIFNTRVREYVGKSKFDSQRYCSEPAPDAFSAFSSSLSGDAAASGLKGASPDLKARAAIAISESAATIERTQTINLLRESMFRTCERFMSGAISKDELIIQAARDQRAMVAVLAIEQLTGAIKAKATVISAGGAAATYSDPTALYQALKSAQDDQTRAQAEVDGLQKAFDAKDDNNKTCTDILANKPADSATDAEKNRHAGCGTTKSSLAEANTKLERAKGRTTMFQSMAEKQAFGMTASAGAGATFDVGGLPTKPDPQSVATVSASVEHIVKSMVDFNEIRETCVLRLRREPSAVRTKFDDQFDDRCLQLVSSDVQALSAENQARTAKAEAELVKAIDQDLSKFSAFLKADPAKRWKQVVDLLEAAGRTSPRQIAQYRVVTTEAEMETYFSQWSSDIRKLVLAAIDKGTMK